jgi:hypothetical protein
MSKLKWKAPLDPVELKDYVVDWEAEMTASSDTIVSALFELPPEAVTDGLAIASQSNTTTDMTVWFEVPDVGTNRTDILGKKYEIEATVTTNNGRTLNVSSLLKVLDK